MNIDRTGTLLLTSLLGVFSIGCGSGQLEPTPETEAKITNDDYQEDMEAGAKPEDMAATNE